MARRVGGQEGWRTREKKEGEKEQRWMREMEGRRLDKGEKEEQVDSSSDKNENYRSCHQNSINTKMFENKIIDRQRFSARCFLIAFSNTAKSRKGTTRWAWV